MMKRLAALSVALCLCACASHGTALADLLVDDFDGPDGLIMAEGQPVPPGEPWEMTSGSLFRNDGAGWSGVPDDTTGSTVFRMVSVERDFDNVDVSMALRVDDLVAGRAARRRRTTTARTSGCATNRIASCTRRASTGAMAP